MRYNIKSKTNRVRGSSSVEGKTNKTSNPRTTRD